MGLKSHFFTRSNCSGYWLVF